MTIKLTMPDGHTATIAADTGWTSDSDELAEYLNLLNAQMGACNELPHPFLHVAEYMAESGATFITEGEDDGEEGDIH